MHNMALRPQALHQPTPLRQHMPLRQPMGLLEDMPVEPTVALLVARLQLLPVRRPLLLPVGPPTPLAPVRRLMPSLEVKDTHNSRMNGMPPPARTDAATCVSRTPTRCVDTVSKRRAHPRRDERPSPLNLSPARCGAFLC